VDKRSRLAVWLQGDGIEIGALHRPLVAPSGARVTYVDRMPDAELRAHYPELADLKLTPVTVVGSAEDLSAFTDNSLDFIIANHLLEHLEDPIAGLIEFHRALRPGGALYMALPDSRVTFDRTRELTPPEHLIDEHRHGTNGNREAHYRDFVVNAENREADVDARVAELMKLDYSIHFHCWRASTFLEFLLAAEKEAGIEFEVAAFAPPEHQTDDEFILVLLKGHSATVRLPPSPMPVASDGPTRPRSLPAKALQTLVLEGPRPLLKKSSAYLRRRANRNRQS
jgi:SAM-dependent methyltransferase